MQCSIRNLKVALLVELANCYCVLDEDCTALLPTLKCACTRRQISLSDLSYVPSTQHFYIEQRKRCPTFVLDLAKAAFNKQAARVIPLAETYRSIVKLTSDTTSNSESLICIDKLGRILKMDEFY